MRVLLAGATGVIGRHVIPHLQRAGHTVTGLTRRPGAVQGTGANELVADLNDRAAFLAALRAREFDAVIHHATAMARNPRSYTQMRQTNRLRSEGTSTLLAAARATGATRFVAASAFYGYGLDNLGARPLGEDVAFGEKPGGPIDPVYAALVTNEQQARAFGGVALRLGLVYNADGSTLPAPKRWQGELPFVHIDDVASATAAALQAPAGSVYNIVDDAPASWAELQAERARVFERPAPSAVPDWWLRRVAPFAGTIVTSTSMRLSNERARAELGWAPAFESYVDGLASFAAAEAATAEVRTQYPAEAAPSRPPLVE